MLIAELWRQALQIIDRASERTYRDKIVYTVLTLVMLALFSATFTQLLIRPSSVILDCAMFLLRAALALLGFYSLCMATLFNRYLLPPTWHTVYQCSPLSLVETIIVLLCQLSYAIKNLLKACRMPPTWLFMA